MLDRLWKRKTARRHVGSFRRMDEHEVPAELRDIRMPQNMVPWYKIQNKRELPGHAEFEEGDQIAFELSGMAERFALFCAGKPLDMQPHHSSDMRRYHYDMHYSMGVAGRSTESSGVKSGTLCAIERVLFKLPAVSAYKISKTTVRDSVKVHLAYFIALIHDAGTPPPSREMEKRAMQFWTPDIKFPFACDTAHVRNLTLLPINPRHVPEPLQLLERDELKDFAEREADWKRRFPGPRVRPLDGDDAAYPASVSIRSASAPLQASAAPDGISMRFIQEFVASPHSVKKKPRKTRKTRRAK